MDMIEKIRNLIKRINVTTVKRTALYVVLGVSLAINAYVIGAIGYYSYKFRVISQDTTWIEKRLDRGEERFLSHLEGEDKELAREVIAERKPPLRAAFIDLLEARQSVIVTLRTNDPDPQALAGVMTRSQQAVEELNENFHGLLRDITLGLSPEGRRKIGERLARHRRNWDRER